MASSGIMKKTLKIDGMTCVSCENRIERKLQNTPGIFEAKVSYSGGTATVTYDSRAITLEGIAEIIEKLDYKVKNAFLKDGQISNIVKTLGVVIVLFALYMLASRFGVLNIFNSFPQAEKNTGYAMLLPDNGSAAYSIPTENVAVAKIEDGVQRAEITVDQNGFSPAVVVLQSGVKTEWVINAISPSEGTSVLLFPKYYAQIGMKEGANEISLVPEGDFDFSTVDASYFGYVKVVDDLQTADLDNIRQEIGKYTPVFWD